MANHFAHRAKELEVKAKLGKKILEDGVTHVIASKTFPNVRSRTDKKLN
jgi:hypothetical protein